MANTLGKLSFASKFLKNQSDKSKGIIIINDLFLIGSILITILRLLMIRGLLKQLWQLVNFEKHI